jgi:hypothetical protein
MRDFHNKIKEKLEYADIRKIHTQIGDIPYHTVWRQLTGRTKPEDRVIDAAISFLQKRELHQKELLEKISNL